MKQIKSIVEVQDEKQMKCPRKTRKARKRMVEIFFKEDCSMKYFVYFVFFVEKKLASKTNCFQKFSSSTKLERNIALLSRKSQVLLLP